MSETGCWYCGRDAAADEDGNRVCAECDGIETVERMAIRGVRLGSDDPANTVIVRLREQVKALERDAEIACLRALCGEAADLIYVGDDSADWWTRARELIARLRAAAEGR